ncbi:MAG: hypothetical protein NT120_00440, partial [Candidatus Aenigmarchaeota archaeon]|nr:hypothetical protein [Candidatus Aenigmarchaeota archaeon]
MNSLNPLEIFALIVIAILVSINVWRVVRFWKKRRRISEMERRDAAASVGGATFFTLTSVLIAILIFKPDVIF